jgi:hypothetical protein
MDASVSRAYAQRWLRGKRPSDDQVRVWRLVSAPHRVVRWHPQLSAECPDRGPEHPDAAGDAEHLITWSVAVCPQGRRVALDLMILRSRVQAPAAPTCHSALVRPVLHAGLKSAANAFGVADARGRSPQRSTPHRCLRTECDRRR